MLSTLLSKLQLHAPPTTLVVAILAWIFGNKLSGSTLQEIGQLVTCVLAGAYVPPAASAAANTVKTAASKVAGTGKK